MGATLVMSNGGIDDIYASYLFSCPCDVWRSFPSYPLQASLDRCAVFSQTIHYGIWVFRAWTRPCFCVGKFTFWRIRVRTLCNPCFMFLEKSHGTTPLAVPLAKPFWLNVVRSSNVSLRFLLVSIRVYCIYTLRNHLAHSFIGPPPTPATFLLGWLLRGRCAWRGCFELGLVRVFVLASSRFGGFGLEPFAILASCSLKNHMAQLHLRFPLQSLSG